MKILSYILIMIMSAGLLACGDDDFPVPQASTVDAAFSFEADEKVVTFMNESRLADNAGTVSYTWNFGDGTFSQEANPVHEYDNVGIYDVSLVAISEDDMDTYEASVVVLGSVEARLFYIDGSARQIAEVQGDVVFETDGTGYGVAYDAVNSKLYYTDASNGTLMRADADGSDAEEVASGFEGARDLALNTTDGKAYVVDRPANEVIEVDLATGETQVLYSTANGLGELPVAIDYYDGYLYITCVEIDFETVWKAKADGSSVENIIGYGAGGYGYGLAVDPVNEKIYFDDQENGVILRSNLDGTGIETVVEKVGRVYGIVIDNTNGKFYFSDTGDGLIKKANLDGSELVPVTLELDDPLGLAIVE